MAFEPLFDFSPFSSLISCPALLHFTHSASATLAFKCTHSYPSTVYFFLWWNVLCSHPCVASSLISFSSAFRFCPQRDLPSCRRKKDPAHHLRPPYSYFVFFFNSTHQCMKILLCLLLPSSRTLHVLLTNVPLAPRTEMISQ